MTARSLASLRSARGFAADDLRSLGHRSRLMPMGASSVGLPCICRPAGPMLRGNWRGQVMGLGSDACNYWDEPKGRYQANTAARRAEVA